jgi:hypothetical protein
MQKNLIAVVQKLFVAVMQKFLISVAQKLNDSLFPQNIILNYK